MTTPERPDHPENAAEPPAVTPEELHELAAHDQRYADLLDPQRRRDLLFRMMADSGDPMWREIGQSLRDGSMGLRDILRVEAYREKVETGLATHAEHFHQSLHDATEALRADTQRPAHWEDPRHREDHR